MTTVPRYLKCPPPDIRIREWWAHCYDHIYVVLNPFFHVPGYSPKDTAYGPTHVGNTSVSQVLESIQAPSEAESAAPEDYEDIIKRIGKPVSWSTVQDGIGATDFMTFARTVWLWTLEVQRHDRDESIVGALDTFCAEQELYPPEEDQLPAVMEPLLGRFLEALAIEDVDLWSEWRKVSKRVATSAFRKDNPTVFINSGKVFEKISAVAAPGLLLSWEFDDVAGLLCLKDGLHQKADPLRFFEGFAVTGDMYADVFNPRDASGCGRQRDN